MKKAVHAVIALSLSAAGLWWALRGVDMHEVVEACRRTGRLWLFLLVPLWTGLEFLLRTLRWRRLLAAQASLPFRRLMPLTMAGFFLNNVLPFRAGEAARLFWTSRETGRPPAACAAVLGLDRFFDVLALATLLAMATLGLGRFTGAGASAAMMGAAAAGATLALWLVARNPARAADLARRARLPGRVCRWVEEFAQGAAPVAEGRSFLGAYALSLTLWFLMAGFFAAMSRVFGLDLSWLEAAGLVVSFALGAAVPAAPGYFGTLEAAGVAYLMAAGQPRPEAVSYVLSVHLLQFLSAALYGVPSLLAMRERRPDA